LKKIVPVVIVVLAIMVAFWFDTGGGVAYSVRSTNERGASLLFDTLAHMGYGVNVGRRPLNMSAAANDVYVLIQARAVCSCMATEMRDWVREGGRLIFLCGSHPNTIISRDENLSGRQAGDFWLYRLGRGEIITGRAIPVTNYELMNDFSAGEAIQATISRWNSEREIGNIFFAEYYHGVFMAQTGASQMPLVMRLMILQAIVFAAIGVLHLGKRFGNPLPYYEEVEREENEYVHALARLYMATGKKGDGKDA